MLSEALPPFEPTVTAAGDTSMRHGAASCWMRARTLLTTMSPWRGEGWVFAGTLN
jgi:hypothetical protein